MDSSPVHDGESFSSLLKCSMPSDLVLMLHNDPISIKKASTDFGNMVHLQPSAVFFPSCAEDIRRLVELSNTSSTPFPIAVRGNGHSTRGESMAPNGVVIDMEELRRSKKKVDVLISDDRSYADVGGEVLWRDVVKETFASGVLPVSWVNFLGLTVGGTLSNCGVNGETFRTGPQISKVLEMDVITGKGTMVTCSPLKDSELFYAVLGGLGQFGIITRARIPLQPAKQWVRWVRVFYTDFDAFKSDEESLVAFNDKTVTFVVGHLLIDTGSPNEWTYTFIPSEEHPVIQSLVKKHGIIYSIEMAEAYNISSKHASLDKMKRTIERLNCIKTMVYEIDVPYPAFLDRIQVEGSEGLAHPWLNIFVPRSRISEVHSGSIKNILLKHKNTLGPLLMYPMNKIMWDERMSVPIPAEDVFYMISMVLACKASEWKDFMVQIDDILKFCRDGGVPFKTYLHRHSTVEDWKEHFGEKWKGLKKMKEMYDPNHILSPQQRIFN